MTWKNLWRNVTKLFFSWPVIIGVEQFCASRLDLTTFLARKDEMAINSGSLSTSQSYIIHYLGRGSTYFNVYENQCIPRELQDALYLSFWKEKKKKSQIFFSPFQAIRGTYVYILKNSTENNLNTTLLIFFILGVIHKPRGQLRGRGISQMTILKHKA